MFQKIADHFRHFRVAYLVVSATLMTVAGLASYDKGVDFYAGNPRWLMASVLADQKTDPYTRGEFMMDTLKQLKKTKCFESLCADMKGGMPEEKARCELEKRGVFDKKAGYKWFDQEFVRAEAIKVLVKSFKVPMVEKARQPFKDVPTDAWFAPFVTAAYKDGLIGNNSKRQFQPELVATQKWIGQALRRTDLKQFCAVEK